MRQAVRAHGRRRGIEVGAALVLLALASPLLLLGVVAVLLDSGRPVFFGHVRVGLGGRPFRCWKLRTMGVGAERRLDREPELRRRYIQNGFKLPTRADPRVTCVGRWLRRTYIDEIPQLYNVLNGTMSLVGPRPVVDRELAFYNGAAQALLARRPGIFGAWTSLGPRRPDYPERARIELEYVNNRTAARDLLILVRSVGAVLRGQPEL